MEWSRQAQTSLCQRLDVLYRDCQEFATVRIKQAVDEVFSDFQKTESGPWRCHP
jgi:hypothetical protein